VLQRAAECALAAGVDGMRADLVMLRAARALAAFERRTEVTTDDVDAVAELALAHRREEGKEGRSSPAPAPKADMRPAAPTSAGSSAPSANSSPMGDWGALPPVPEATARVQPEGGWPAKKA